MSRTRSTGSSAPPNFGCCAYHAGQGGYGIQTAPALARAAANLLVDGVRPDDLLAQGMVAEDLLPLRLRLRPAPASAVSGP
jgi:glycine/D-amino acid oxidase-like deaminating enzyme